MGKLIQTIRTRSQLPDCLRKVLLKPGDGIPESMLDQLVACLIEVAICTGDDSFPIEPEYIREGEYNPLVHGCEEGRCSHTALRGRNCFPFSIYALDGNGEKREIISGERFRTHIPVYLDA